MFDYDPDDARKCWPAGEYEATLEHVLEGLSKKGKPMLTVKWKVYSGNGRSQLLNDYIVNPSTLWKLRDIAFAIGMKQEFEDREFDLTRQKGSALMVRLNVTDSEQFGEQNQIGSYKKLDRTRTPAAPLVSTELDDDEEVPF